LAGSVSCWTAADDREHPHVRPGLLADDDEDADLAALPHAAPVAGDQDVRDPQRAGEAHDRRGQVRVAVLDPVVLGLVVHRCQNSPQ